MVVVVENPDTDGEERTYNCEGDNDTNEGHDGVGQVSDDVELGI